MAQVITDDFNRASLGSNYLLTQGTAMAIQGSTRLQPNDTGLSHSTIVQTANKWCRDQYAKITLTSVETSNYCGLVVRADPSGTATMYFFHVSGFDGSVGKFVDGAYTSLYSNVSLASANNDVIELRIVGSLLTAKKNGTTVFETTDTSIVTGNPGVHGYTNSTGTTSTSADSWEAGDLIAAQTEPMYVPFGSNDFGWFVSNHTSRPAAAMGTAITPGNNTKGSYTQLLTALANDVYGIRIVLNSGSASAGARDMIVDIGIDEAGGTSYTVKIPDLLGSCSSGVDVMGGIQYYFPLFIRAGSTVAARASVNNATVGSTYVWVTCYGRPRNPEMCKVGSYVEAIGIVSASSRGTTITAGTTSDGAWTSLGSTTKENWWWQAGKGVNDSTMSVGLYTLDVAVGSTGQMPLITDQTFRHDGTERQSSDLMIAGCERYVPSGSAIYARIQCSGTADAGLSAAVWGLGG